jgi:hypothetical protein
MQQLVGQVDDPLLQPDDIDALHFVRPRRHFALHLAQDGVADVEDSGLGNTPPG